MKNNKNIGIFHFQVGGTDGVSLEIEKWKHILEEMGHTVHLIGGDLGVSQGILVEEMFHHLPESKRLYQNTFSRLSDFDPNGYREELDRMTQPWKLFAKNLAFLRLLTIMISTGSDGMDFPSPVPVLLS